MRTTNILDLETGCLYIYVNRFSPKENLAHCILLNVFRRFDYWFNSSAKNLLDKVMNEIIETKHCYSWKDRFSTVKEQYRKKE